MQYKAPLQKQETKWVLDSGQSGQVDYNKYAYEVCQPGPVISSKTGKQVQTSIQQYQAKSFRGKAA